MQLASRWILFINTSYIKITEVNLSAFVYKLFHEDSSPIVRTNLDVRVILEQIWTMNTTNPYLAS